MLALAVGCSGPAPQTGGCADGGHCAAGEYCERPLGACEDVGRCAVRPEFCIEIYQPVCGCDGETYANACKAAAAGSSIAAERECLN
jgi:hypothetical protein